MIQTPPDRGTPIGLRALTVAGAAVLCLVPPLAGAVLLHTALPFEIPLVAAAVVAGACGWLLFDGARRGRTPEILGGLLGAVPLVVALSAARVVHWDDFMTWLPNALSISVFGRPAFAMPEGAVPSTWGAYPPAASLAVAAVWAVFGRGLETAAGWINVLALLSLSGLILREVGARAATPTLRFSGALLAALGVTFLNPSLDWHWVLSGCPDTLTGVALAVAGFGARRVWLDRDEDRGWNEALILGVALGLVAALKQTGVILIALLVGGTALLALLHGTYKRGPGRVLALAGLSLGPAVLVWGAWRGCLALSGAPGEMGFLPFSQWHFAVAPKTLTAIGAESLDRGLRTAPELIALVVGAIVWIRVIAARIAGHGVAETPARIGAALFAPLWVGFSLFLFAAEIGAFSEGEAERAAEWTRYQAQVAQFGLIVAAAPAWERWGGRLSRVSHRVVAGLAGGLLIVAVAGTAVVGAPRPVLGLHWAGVLDAGEIATLRDLASEAAIEARAVGVDTVALAIVKPTATPRADQISPWHTRSLGTLIVNFQLWKSDVARPIGLVWREPGTWRSGSDRVVIEVGGADGSAVWVRENGDWRRSARMADPPSLTPFVQENHG